MRSHLAISFYVVLALAAGACNRSSAERTYTLQGQVLSVGADRRKATVKHEEIKGLMPAMTMPYWMKDSTLLDGILQGDLIQRDAGDHVERRVCDAV